MLISKKCNWFLLQSKKIFYNIRKRRFRIKKTYWFYWIQKINNNCKKKTYKFNIKYSKFKSIEHCESNLDKIIQTVRSSKRINHENDQFDHVNIKFSIEFNKLIFSNMFRNVCTIEQINWLYNWKSAN